MFFETFKIPLSVFISHHAKNWPTQNSLERDLVAKPLKPVIRNFILIFFFAQVIQHSPRTASHSMAIKRLFNGHRMRSRARRIKDVPKNYKLEPYGMNEDINRKAVTFRRD